MENSRLGHPVIFLNAEPMLCLNQHGNTVSKQPGPCNVAFAMDSKAQSLTGIFCVAKNCFTSLTELAASEFFGWSEWQAAFALEEFFQPTVAGTAFAPDDFRRNKVAHFATKPPAFQPVFPTDGTFNRNAADF